MYFPDNSVGFAIPRKSGGIIVGLGKTVSHLNWETKEVTMVMELDKECETRMNDAKCDCRGRLWAGTVIIIFLVLPLITIHVPCCVVFPWKPVRSVSYHMCTF